MLLKLNLALFFMLIASVVDANGQTTAKLATPSREEVRVNINGPTLISDAVLNEYSTSIHQITPESRPMVVPFSCESGLVYIITNVIH